MKTSPLAPSQFPKLPLVKGVTFSTGSAGIKYKNRDDVMLAVMAEGTAVAGVYTTSSTRSANVLDCQVKTEGTKTEGGTTGPAAFLVNSGNSNAFTGHHGVTAVEGLCDALSAFDIPKTRIFTASTGVIGEPLPYEKITNIMGDLVERQTENQLEAAAHAIMTTDTFAKGAARILEIDEKTVNIAGIAKGSGMIAPDMATMLVYIFTDAKLAQGELQKMLSAHVQTTFNSITVDGDTSTSDTLLCAATGASGVDVSGNEAFSKAFHEVMLDLAHQVVRDGEGATKFIEVNVRGATSKDDARKVALSIANSPLVKTAIAGEDPNWGRIVMAVGKSGATADRDKLSISFGDCLVAENGWVAPSYKEEFGQAHMKNSEIVLNVDLGLGSESHTIWTCDLTHDYISINADYRS